MLVWGSSAAGEPDGDPCSNPCFLLLLPCKLLPGAGGSRHFPSFLTSHLPAEGGCRLSTEQPASHCLCHSEHRALLSGCISAELQPWQALCLLLLHLWLQQQRMAACKPCQEHRWRFSCQADAILQGPAPGRKEILQCFVHTNSSRTKTNECLMQPVIS